jgi:hypothetical protein
MVAPFFLRFGGVAVGADELPEEFHGIAVLAGGFNDGTLDGCGMAFGVDVGHIIARNARGLGVPTIRLAMLQDGKNAAGREEEEAGENDTEEIDAGKEKWRQGFIRAWSLRDVDGDERQDTSADVGIGKGVDELREQGRSHGDQWMMDGSNKSS